MTTSAIVLFVLMHFFLLWWSSLGLFGQATRAQTCHIDAEVVTGQKESVSTLLSLQLLCVWWNAGHFSLAVSLPLKGTHLHPRIWAALPAAVGPLSFWLCYYIHVMELHAGNYKSGIQRKGGNVKGTNGTRTIRYLWHKWGFGRKNPYVSHLLILRVWFSTFRI